jgi:hypothetical protein
MDIDTTAKARRSRRYLDQAHSYGCAAAALAVDEIRQDLQHPYFMLVAHGAELALKAVIAGGDMDDEQLIIVGHDLKLCLRLAVHSGLDLDGHGQIEEIVSKLAMPHLAQALRYPAYLAWPLPEPGQALQALEALLERVEERLEPLGRKRPGGGHLPPP